MAIRIRNALLKDYESIDRLNIEAYAEYETVIGTVHWQKMREGLSNIAKFADPGVILVAENDFKLVGSVVYFPPGRSDGIIFPQEWTSIRLLSVSPFFRGSGIGQRLTEECIQRAKQDRAEKFGLHTGKMMTVARRMYENMGFQKDADLGSRFGVLYTRYVMNFS